MKILIVFGSLLGKTQRTALVIGKILQQAGHDITVKDVRSASVGELNGYDLNILGCSTWDDGVLQFDFRPFHKELIQNKFPGKRFAVFGLGSHKYPHPFGAVGILQEAVQTIEGQLIIEPVKFDLDHDDPEDLRDKEIIAWGQNLATLLK